MFSRQKTVAAVWQKFICDDAVTVSANGRAVLDLLFPWYRNKFSLVLIFVPLEHYFYANIKNNAGKFIFMT